MEDKNEIVNHEAPADISAIVAEAAKDEALQQPAATTVEGSGEEVETPQDYEEQANELVELAADSLTEFYPTLKAVITPEKCANIAKRGARLMEKYKLSTGGILGKWGEEIMFAVIMGKLGFQVVQIIRHENAKDEALKTTEAIAVSSPMAPVMDQTDPDSLHNRA